MAYHAHSTSMASFPLTAAADFAVRQNRQPSLLRPDIAEIQAADSETNPDIEKAAGVAALGHGVEAHFGEVGKVIDFDVPILTAPRAPFFQRLPLLCRACVASLGPRTPQPRLSLPP